jgi:hypothetical protein
MSQTLEMLLSLKPEDIRHRPGKQVYMPRLSELAGAKVCFTIQALTLDEAKEIRESAAKIRFNKAHEREDFYDEEEAALFAILKGVIDPDLKDRRLLEKLAVPTPKELVKRLLLSGEIASLSEQIMKLSGFNSLGETDGEEIKNL